MLKDIPRSNFPEPDSGRVQSNCIEGRTTGEGKLQKLKGNPSMRLGRISYIGLHGSIGDHGQDIHRHIHAEHVRDEACHEEHHSDAQSGGHMSCCK